MKSIIKNSVKISFFSLLTLTSFYGLAVKSEVTVSVEAVQQAPLKSVLDIHGTVYGRKDVKLTAGASGLLTYVAEPGSHVAKGDVIARIDLLPLELKKAEQVALIKRAKINSQYQQRELERLKSLALKDSTAAFKVDEIQTKYDLALSDIEIAELKLRQLNEQIIRATVLAPFSGVISQRIRQAGGDVSKADELVTLLDTHNLEARLYIPVKYLTYIKQGSELNIRPDDLTADLSSKAKVRAIIPATDARSQTFEIRADIESSQIQKWATGQLVKVQVPIITSIAKILVNRDALILRKDGIYIVKIDKENKAKRIQVNVGQGEGALVEITPKSAQDVLSQGDVVAIRGAERLTEGQEVSIQL